VRFRKKPVVIEAWRNSDEGEWPAWVEAAVTDRGHGGVLFIQTLEGTMEAGPGDWLIRGVVGEVYPVKDPIFRETYEPVGEGAR
jgi:hypothetical protein